MKIEIKVSATNKETNAVMDAVTAYTDAAAAFARMRVGRKTINEFVGEAKNALAGGLVGDVAETYDYKVEDGHDEKTHHLKVVIPDNVVIDGLGMITDAGESVGKVVAPALITAFNVVNASCSTLGGKMMEFAEKHKPEERYGYTIIAKRDDDSGCVALVTFSQRKSFTGSWGRASVVSLDARHYGDYETYEKAIRRDADEVLRRGRIVWHKEATDAYNEGVEKARNQWEKWAKIKLAQMRDHDGKLIGCEKRLIMLDGSERTIDVYYPTGDHFRAEVGEYRVLDQNAEHTISCVWGTMKRDVGVALGVALCMDSKQAEE